MDENLHEAAAMLEPVILPEIILSQARLWRDECLRRWTDDDVFPRIGEATLPSAVDNEPRNVTFHLASGFNVKGKTFVGVRSGTGDSIGAGYTIVLNRGLIDQRERLTHILLHELTHAVDPYFDEDVRRQEIVGQLTDPSDLYNLPSEQRAFAAMWTEDLREDLAQGQFRNSGASIVSYRQRSREFDGFWGYAQLHRHDLAEQTRWHFRRMVEDLRRR